MRRTPSVHSSTSKATLCGSAKSTLLCENSTERKEGNLEGRDLAGDDTRLRESSAFHWELRAAKTLTVGESELRRRQRREGGSVATEGSFEETASHGAAGRHLRKETLGR